MSYSIEKAKLVADQIERLATQNPYQLAGQSASFDFWSAEALEALAAIADYSKRFKRMRDAQTAWINAHGSVAYEHCDHCGGACELADGTPPQPMRVSSKLLDEAATAVRKALRRYTLRLFRMRLLEEDAVLSLNEKADLHVEPEDLIRLEEEPGRDPPVFLPNPNRGGDRARRPRGR
jgi:hypothetical protein